MGSDNPSGAVNQQETAEIARARCRLGGRLRRWRGVLLASRCVRNPWVRSTRALADPARVSPGLPAQRPSSACSKLLVEVLRVRQGRGAASKRQPPRAVVPLLRGQPARRPRERRVVPFFEDKPAEIRRRRADFETVRCTSCECWRRKEHLTPKRGSSVIGSTRLRHECNGKQRRGRWTTYLAGSSETVRQALPARMTEMRQSELHGDMESKAEMTLPVSAELMSNKVPKVAKFLVG